MSWKSQRQQTFALSTAEAEYMALCQASKEGMFSRNLLCEVGFQQKEQTVIFEDNQSCIFIATNPISNTRTKHIDIQYHYICEKATSGDLKIEYCPTNKM